VGRVRRLDAERGHKMDDPVEIGEQIREERESRGLSRRVVADMYGKSTSWEFRIEMGETLRGGKVGIKSIRQQKQVLAKLRSLPSITQEMVTVRSRKIRDLRQRLGLSQREVALACRIERADISRIETDTLAKRPSLLKVVSKQQVILNELKRLEKEGEKPMPLITSKAKTDELRVQKMAVKAEELKTKESDPAYQVAMIETEISNIGKDREKITARIAEIGKELSKDEGLAVSFLVEGKRKLARERGGLEEDLVIAESPLAALEARRSMLLKEIEKADRKKLVAALDAAYEYAQKVERYFQTMTASLASDIGALRGEIATLRKLKSLDAGGGEG